MEEIRGTLSPDLREHKTLLGCEHADRRPLEGNAAALSQAPGGGVRFEGQVWGKGRSSEERQELSHLQSKWTTCLGEPGGHAVCVREGRSGKSFLLLPSTSPRHSWFRPLRRVVGGGSTRAIVNERHPACMGESVCLHLPYSLPPHHP